MNVESAAESAIAVDQIDAGRVVHCIPAVFLWNSLGICLPVFDDFIDLLGRAGKSDDVRPKTGDIVSQNGRRVSLGIDTDEQNGDIAA